MSDPQDADAGAGKKETKMAFSFKVEAARDKRASRLADAVIEWQRLANQNKWPRSLHGILRTALEHEYELGLKRGKRR